MGPSDAWLAFHCSDAKEEEEVMRFKYISYAEEKEEAGPIGAHSRFASQAWRQEELIHGSS